MKYSIYAIESNYRDYVYTYDYEMHHTNIVFATIDKAKAYKQFEHYIELIKKETKRDCHVNLIVFNVEHFATKIASYDNKNGLDTEIPDLSVSNKINESIKPITMKDLIEKCTYTDKDLSYLEKFDVYCDGRKVVKAEEDDHVLNLNTSLL